MNLPFGERDAAEQLVRREVENEYLLAAGNRRDRRGRAHGESAHGRRPREWVGLAETARGRGSRGGGCYGGLFDQPPSDPVADHVELALRDLRLTRRHLWVAEMRREKVERAIVRLPRDRDLPRHTPSQDSGEG